MAAALRISFFKKTRTRSRWCSSDQRVARYTLITGAGPGLARASSWSLAATSMGIAAPSVPRDALDAPAVLHHDVAHRLHHLAAHLEHGRSLLRIGRRGPAHHRHAGHP